MMPLALYSSNLSRHRLPCYAWLKDFIFSLRPITYSSGSKEWQVNPVADLPSRQQSDEAAAIVGGQVGSLDIPDSFIDGLMDDELLGPCISLFNDVSIQRADLYWRDAGRQ